MPLSITPRVEDNVGIIELSGSLTLGPSLISLREGARQLLTAPKLAGIVLLMRDVSVTDSSGLGELTVVYTLTSKRGCPIRLAECTASLRKMLEMTRLDGLLPCSRDVAAAKAELRHG